MYVLNICEDMMIAQIFHTDFFSPRHTEMAHSIFEFFRKHDTPDSIYPVVSVQCFFFSWMIFKLVAEPQRMFTFWCHPGALLAFSSKREINQRNRSEVQNKILYSKMLIYTVNSQMLHRFLELTVILVIDHAYCNPHSLLLVPYPVTNIWLVFLFLFYQD